MTESKRAQFSIGVFSQSLAKAVGASQSGHRSLSRARPRVATSGVVLARTEVIVSTNHTVQA